jgi:glycosyltransferase involved in cell wall biosynthesis
VHIGNLGQSYEPKGQYLLVEAMGSYRQRFEEANIRFLIFGNNLPGMRRNLEELSRLTQQLHCQHLIAFPGWADDAHEVMQGLDVVLRTDLTGSPWGRDIIEAMSHGLPVIASGQSEVFVKHGQTGRLFPPGDVHAMVRHILDLARNPQERERYGRHALEFARQHFSPSLYAQRVATILDSVATNRSRV